MTSGRYELKFPISSTARDRFFEDARVELQADPHALGGCYRVTSLYFDTPGLDGYWEKLDGEEERRKYRLRCYSRDLDAAPDLGTGRLEIKHRLGNRVSKQRVLLTPEGAASIVAGEVTLVDLDSCLDPSENRRNAMVSEVVRAARPPAGIRPATVITYVREAYESALDPRLRITFDHFVEAYPSGGFRDAARGQGELLVAPGWGILEVKFDRAIPRRIRDILGTHGLPLRRFSKYAAGVEALGLLPHMARSRLGARRLANYGVFPAEADTELALAQGCVRGSTRRFAGSGPRRVTAPGH